MSLSDEFWNTHEKPEVFQPITRWKDKNKAGLIPYFIEPDGSIKFLMMIASDPKFGGFKPMISKGTIEDNETTLECAIREAAEEVGLIASNMKTEPFEIFDQYVTLRSVEYHMTVFAVEVKSKLDFADTGCETKFTSWMTMQAFADRGRKDHQAIVEKLYKLLTE